jgi:hypothetical protein
MRQNCSRTFHILCRFTGNFIANVWKCQLLAEVPTRELTHHKKPVRTRQSSRYSNQTPQVYIQKRCCLNQPLRRQLFKTYTIKFNQRYFQRAFPTTAMTANTTDGMYPRLVSIFCYGFLTRVWCYLYISTDPQYIGVPLQTMKTNHHAGNTNTANIGC